jgi:hypothetical protein
MILTPDHREQPGLPGTNRTPQLGCDRAPHSTGARPINRIRRIQRAFASQLGIPLRNDKDHVCARSAQPPRVPVGGSLTGTADCRQNTISMPTSGLLLTHRGSCVCIVNRSLAPVSDCVDLAEGARFADPVRGSPGACTNPATGCGLGPTKGHYQDAAPGQNERPRLLLRCHEAQRGATSSIRKTAGLTFGTTYVV